MFSTLYHGLQVDGANKHVRLFILPLYKISLNLIVTSVLPVAPYIMLFWFGTLWDIQLGDPCPLPEVPWYEFYTNTKMPRFLLHTPIALI